MKKCVTHHYACDCREAMFEEMRIRNLRLEELLKIATVMLVQIATTSLDIEWANKRLDEITREDGQ